MVPVPFDRANVDWWLTCPATQFHWRKEPRFCGLGLLDMRLDCRWTGTWISVGERYRYDRIHDTSMRGKFFFPRYVILENEYCYSNPSTARETLYHAFLRTVSTNLQHRVDISSMPIYGSDISTPSACIKYPRILSQITSPAWPAETQYASNPRNPPGRQAGRSDRYVSPVVALLPILRFQNIHASLAKKDTR